MQCNECNVINVMNAQNVMHSLNEYNSSLEVIFHWGRLALSFSSLEVIFNKDCLLMWLSSICMLCLYAFSILIWYYSWWVASWVGGRLNQLKIRLSIIQQGWGELRMSFATTKSTLYGQESANLWDYTWVISNLLGCVWCLNVLVQ